MNKGFRRPESSMQMEDSGEWVRLSHAKPPLCRSDSSRNMRTLTPSPIIPGVLPTRSKDSFGSRKTTNDGLNLGEYRHGPNLMSCRHEVRTDSASTTKVTPSTGF
jgi:hypothetical protein